MSSPVVLPVDRLAALWPSELKGLRVGALLHAASITSQCQPVVDLLGELDGELFQLTTLFGPQHGFAGTTQDNMITDAKLGSIDVVRSNRPALGDAIAQHAHTGHRDRLPRHVPAGSNQPVGRTRDNPAF